VEKEEGRWNTYFCAILDELHAERPILVGKDKVLVSFKEDEWEKELLE